MCVHRGNESSFLEMIAPAAEINASVPEKVLCIVVAVRPAHLHIYMFSFRSPWRPNLSGTSSLLMR
jgi:hypothetical protein